MKSDLQFVSLVTIANGSNDERGVSIMYSPKTGEFELLGGISHGAELKIDQKFIDDLQKILDSKNQ